MAQVRQVVKERPTQQASQPGPKRQSRLSHELRHVRRALVPRLRAANLLSALLPSNSLSTVRAAIYRRAGFAIAPKVALVSSIEVQGTGPEIYKRLIIGSGTLVGHRPTFVLDDRIIIGRNVSIGPNVTIFTGTHLFGPASRRMNPEVLGRPVEIEDGAWIGAGTIILPGVVIGRGSVTNAGAVVTESVPPNTLVAGNPAKPVMELPWADL